MKKLERYGFGLYALASAVALVRLLAQPIPGHYRVFTRAAHALWAHETAYGTDFGTSVGDWFYSPSCGLFVFGPFSLLPEKLGLALYVILSWAIFTAGARALIQAVCRAWPARNQSGAATAIFWAGICPQVFGAVLASKLELAMTGIVFFVCAWLIGERTRAASVRAGILLGIITNWKFQPLPTAGLLALGLLLIAGDWVFPVVFAATLFVAYLAPLVVLPWNYFLFSHLTWSRTLQEFVESSWLNFENIFTFVQHAFGLTFGWGVARALSAFAGLSFAAILAAFIVKASDRLPELELRARTILLAAALGAAYTASFSPLGQNNAYVLYAPLLLAGALICDRVKARVRWGVGLAYLLAGMILPYTDLIPVSLRDHLRYLSPKPFFCLSFALILALGAAFSPQGESSLEACL